MTNCNTNKSVKIVALTERWAMRMTRIIEFSNYIRYLISFIVTNIMTAGNEYDRNKPIRSRSSRYSRTKCTDCKNCYKIC